MQNIFRTAVTLHYQIDVYKPFNLSVTLPTAAMFGCLFVKSKLFLLLD